MQAASGSAPMPQRLVLLGHPVAHSLSPALQNAAIAAAGLPAHYSVLDTLPEELGATLARLRQENAAGNVTAPHKRAVFQLCDRHSAVARATGAVNTFWVEDRALVGDNTDVGGFDAAVRRLLISSAAETPRRICVIGAGGAAAAVLAAVADWPGATTTVWARAHERAAQLAQRFDHARAEIQVRTALAGAELVVNATPIGSRNDDLPVPLDLMPIGASVFDLVYRAGGTEWVRAATAAGHPAADGLAMLVEQGALAFRCWFGAEPDRQAMWRAVRL